MTPNTIVPASLFLLVLYASHTNCLDPVSNVVATVDESINNRVTITWFWAGVNGANIAFSFEQSDELQTYRAITTSMVVASSDGTNKYSCYVDDPYPTSTTNYRVTVSNTTANETMTATTSSDLAIPGEKPVITLTHDKTTKKLKITWPALRHTPENGYTLTATPTASSSAKYTDVAISKDKLSYEDLATAGEQYTVTLVAEYTTSSTANSATETKNIPPTSPVIHSITFTNETFVTISWGIPTPSGLLDSISTQLSGSSGDVLNRAIVLVKPVTVSNDSVNGTFDVGGLTPGERYDVVMMSVSNNVTSGYSDTTTIVMAPSTPTNITVTNTTTTTFDITWTAGPGIVDNYVIYTSNLSFVHEINSTNTTDTVGNLTPGDSYDVTVAAVSFGRASEESVSVNVSLPPAPPTITSIIVTQSLTSPSMTINWSITGIAATVKIVAKLGEGADIEWTHNASPSSVTKSLTHGQKYTVSMTALSNDLESDSTAYPTSLITNPNKPTFTPSLDTNGKVKISWDTIGQVDKLDIYSGNTHIYTSPNIPSIKGDWTWGGSQDGQRYVITLKVTRFGATQNSDPQTIDTNPAMPTFTATSNTAGLVSFTWNLMATATRIQIKDGAGLFYSRDNPPTVRNAQNSLVRDADPGREYNFLITVTVNGKTASSNSQKVIIIPRAPTITSAAADGKTTDVSVAWTILNTLWDEYTITVGYSGGTALTFTGKSTSPSAQSPRILSLPESVRGYRLTVNMVSKSKTATSVNSIPASVIVAPKKPEIFISDIRTTAFYIRITEPPGKPGTYTLTDTGNGQMVSPFTELARWISNRTPGRKYTLSVISRVNGVDSEKSDAVVVEMVPDKPSITSAAMTGKSLDLVVKWTKPAGDCDSYTLTVYWKFGSQENNKITKNILSTQPRQLTITLSPDQYRGNEVYIDMTCKSNSKTSATVSHAPVTVAPSTPVIDEIKRIELRKFDVSMKSTLGRTERYILEAVPDGGGAATTYPPFMSRFFTVDTMLTPGTRYTLSVTGQSKTVNSYKSATRTVALLPSAPSVQLTASAGGLTIKITSGAGRTESFDITVKKGVDGTPVPYSINDDSSKASVTKDIDDLDAGMYTVDVKAKSNGKFSSMVRKTQSVKAAPVKVTTSNIQAKQFDVSLAWKDQSVTHFVMEISLDNMCVRTVILVVSKEPTNPASCTSDPAVVVNPEVTDMALTYTVPDLDPDLVYKMSIVQHTASTTEDAVIKDVTTDETVPGKIDRIIYVNETKTTLGFCWNKPTPRPGATNYTVCLENREEGSVNKGKETCMNIIGFKVNCTVFEGLEEYYLYIASVYGETRKGKGDTTSSDPPGVRTRYGTPGPIVSVKVSREPNVYTEITLSWQPPAKPDQNSRINKFNIKSPQFTQSMSQDISDDWPRLKEEYTQKIDVKPEHSYTFTVEAVNQGGQIGDSKSVNYDAPAGPPPMPNPTVIAKPDNPDNDVKETSFIVKLDKGLFNDSMNGQVTMYGLIVSNKEKTGSTKKRRAVLTEDTYIKYQNWHTAKLNEFTPYRATPEGWKAESQYMVGADEKCEETDTSTEFCNGPVMGGIEYYVKVFTCTKGGCTETEFIQVATTPKDNSLTVGLAVGLTFCIIIIIVLVVFGILWYRRRVSSNKEPQDNVELMEPGLHKNKSSKGNTTKLKPQDDIELMPDEPAEPDHPKNKPIKLSEFAKEVSLMHNDSDLIFSTDYRCIQELSPRLQVQAARSSGNTGKNRYTDILPFDATRVKLLPLNTDDGDGGDYINANFITGESGRKEYIAAQGPLPATINDFIRMVWEQNVSVIVMLTKCEEKGVTKCASYWPTQSLEEDEPVMYGDITMKLLATSNLNTYTLREMELSMDDKVQRVKQFHYLQMADYSTATIDAFLDFNAEIRSHVRPDHKGPILVHCSAGVGRSGTWIAVDRFRKQIFDANVDTLDVYGMVLGMRHERTKMVQTEAQFVMIHDCVVALIDRKQRDLEDMYANTNVFVNVGFKPDEPEQESLYENSSIMKTEL